MYVSINWIREFVELPKEINNEIAHHFTMSTCEVEEVKKINEHLEKVIVVEILKTEPHPEADKLQLATITTGKEEKVIVCGAKNARAGIKTAFAPIGTTLPDGLTLEPRKVRGILSEGMLCGEVELGIGDDDEGIKEFPSDAPIGATLSDYLGLESDIILDIDNKSITNRPDLWAQYGIAREFSAVFKKPLANPFSKEWEEKLIKQIKEADSPITHTVSKESACKGYFGLAIKNISVGESPAWIQKRLISCGLRPINSMVDISNYVLLELGIPNHIFDLKKIRGRKIEVKKPANEMEFITLDGEKRVITPNDTMIFDAEGPIAVAGVMGGLDSSVSEETTEIFIECANFTDAEIRKTATRLGLRTDSSLRYEKSLDSHLLKRTALRLMELIIKLSPQAQPIGGLNYQGDSLEEPALIIRLESKKISKVLGKEIEESEIIDILTRLDYKVTKEGALLAIEVPTYRATKDIEVDADIIEEIGRIIGYDNITPASPKAEITSTSLSPQKSLHRKIADFMVLHEGATEIMTYPMIGEKLLNKTFWSEKNEKLQLINALSRDSDRMRPSLVPSILEAVQLNSKNFSSFKLFEQGRSYNSDDKNFSKEENWLIAAFYDKKENQILNAINSCEALFNNLNLAGRIIEKKSSSIFPADWIGLHPHEHLTLQVFGKEQGAILSIHPVLTSKLKIKGNLSIILLNLSSFENNELKSRTKYKPLPKFPGSEFDCTVVVPNQRAVADLISPIKKLKVKEISDIKIADIFQLTDKEKAVTIRTHFLDRNKTLDGKFLEESKNKIIDALEKSGFPLKK